MKFDSNFSGRIIQVADALDRGDAVSNQILELDGMFAAMGLKTAIFTKWHHDQLADRRRNLDELDAGERDVLLVHFSGHSEHAVPAALGSYTTRVLVYHNITPAEFFDRSTPLHAHCSKGRAQLREICGGFHFFWGDSSYNVAELKGLGAPRERCHVVPIIVPEPTPAEGAHDPSKWLFVGRIAPNKRQEHLVEMFADVRRRDPSKARSLYLVGGYDRNDPYFLQIQAKVHALELADRVVFTGKVSDDERDAHYRNCGIFVSASEHEGFGVPLVEAPLRGVPVVALQTGAVGETVGTAAGLAPDRDRLLIQLDSVLQDSQRRQELLDAQRVSAMRFSRDAVEASAHDALRRVLPERHQFRTISVVVCTYNRRAYLERVFDYLRYQSDGSFELVVIDGPSTDGTKELLAAKQGVKIAHNAERNLSKSRNLGIELSSGDIVAFIDDDAIPFDDWVETILREYNARPLTTAGLGGPTYYAGTLKFQAQDLAFNRFSDTEAEAGQIGRNGWARTLLGTNSTFTRKAIYESRGFDEQYDYFLDESDFCWRMQEAGNLLGFCTEVLVRHEFAESGNRKSKHNYNWVSICKNTAYFVALYSGLQGAELTGYLRQRFNNERIGNFNKAAKAGEISVHERDEHVAAVWRGLDQGLRDAKHGPRTRPLALNRSAFLPYGCSAARLRVGREVKRLHICILSKEFAYFASRGGIGTLYYQLASELLLMGHSVSLVVPGEEPMFQQGRFRIIYAPRRQYELGPIDSGFANNTNWSLTALAAVSALHLEHPIDVVDSALWDTEALMYSLLPREKRAPLVLRLVTPFPVAAAINDWRVPAQVSDFFTSAERELIKMADAVVPISDSIQHTLQAEYAIVPDARWRKIPCGIAYWPSYDVSSGYAKIDGLEGVPEEALASRKLVVFLGRLERRKGIDLLLEAAEVFLSQDEEAYLLIAGRDVEGWTERASGVLSPSIRSRVFLTGEVDDALRDKLLARAACLVFPSRYESFGLVPLEAFVHEVPVIASRSGAIPEVVLDGHCGLLFDPESSQSLAACVNRLLLDDGMRKKLSAGARERVRTLSSRRMATETVALYSTLGEKR